MPLTKPLPIGAAHPNRETPNFAWASSTKELTESISPLKLIGLSPLLNYTVICQRVSKGSPLLNRVLSDRLVPNAKFQFRWNEPDKGINQSNFTGPLKIAWINSFIKLHCYLTEGFEGAPPLTKPRSIGAAHPKSEIANFDAMSLTKELTKEISRAPLKLLRLIPLLNCAVI